MEHKKLHLKIFVLVFTTMAVIASMAAILVHERQRMREIEAETDEIREIRSDINAAHRRITQLATLGESIIGWEEADYRHYRTRRLRTDSLLQAMKPRCKDFVRPAQIDSSAPSWWKKKPTCCTLWKLSPVRTRQTAFW